MKAAEQFAMSGISDGRRVVEDLLAQGATRDVIVLRIRPEAEPVFREFARGKVMHPWVDPLPYTEELPLRFNGCRVFVDEALGEEYVFYGEAPGGRFSYVSCFPPKPLPESKGE